MQSVPGAWLCSFHHFTVNSFAIACRQCDYQIPTRKMLQAKVDVIAPGRIGKYGETTCMFLQHLKRFDAGDAVLSIHIILLYTVEVHSWQRIIIIYRISM